VTIREAIHDLRLIQDYLGHRDPRHTVHYTRTGRVTKNPVVRGGDPVVVSERTATRTLKTWDRIAARIVEHNGKMILAFVRKSEAAGMAQGQRIGARRKVTLDGAQFVAGDRLLDGQPTNRIRGCFHERLIHDFRSRPGSLRRGAQLRAFLRP
jgi:hypothetical protein